MVRISARISFVLATLLASASLGTSKIPYYGEEFYSVVSQPLQIQSVSSVGENFSSLRETIRKVLRGAHTPTPGGLDIITDSCTQTGCYRHTPLTYQDARSVLLGQIYLVKTGTEYAVKDVYCNRDRSASEFNGNKPGPSVIPDENVVNTEHTWPQSRFTGKYPLMEQKTDLHHLYPTDSQINGTRGNFKFGLVATVQKPLKCPDSKFGYSAANKGELVFQPPENHRGNVARSLFYFSVRYDIAIDPNEEAVLRKWNVEDPVDQAERDRNEAVFKVQGSRNPFIDYPQLADMISDF